eukprot:6141470-Pyramimonas_sp.AAC.1
MPLDRAASQDELVHGGQRDSCADVGQAVQLDAHVVNPELLDVVEHVLRRMRVHFELFVGLVGVLTRGQVHHWLHLLSEPMRERAPDHGGGHAGPASARAALPRPCNAAAPKGNRRPS